MDPVFCFSLTSSFFGPVPTVLLVLLGGYWLWAVLTRQPLERPALKGLGVIGLVLGSSMLLGFDSNSAPVGGSGGTFGELIADGIAANQLVGPTVFLLILAVLASLPVATDWFFLPTLTRMRAARALEAEPSLGRVGRYQVRGGYAHAGADDADVAVIDDEEVEADEVDEPAVEDVAVPGGVGVASDAEEFATDDDAHVVADVANDDEVAPSRSTVLGLTTRVTAGASTRTEVEADTDEDDEDAEDDVPWYSRRTRRPWYEQDADDRIEDEESSSGLDYEEELVGDLEPVEARHLGVDTDEDAPGVAVSPIDDAEDEAGAEMGHESRFAPEVENEPDEDELDSEEDEVRAKFADEEDDADEEDENDDEDVLAAADEEEEEDAEEYEEAEEEEDAGEYEEGEEDADGEIEIEIDHDVEAEEEEEEEDEVLPRALAEEETAEVDLDLDESEDVDDEADAPPSRSASTSARTQALAEEETTAPADRAPARDTEDRLFLQAGDLAVDEGRASISFLQRSMGVGYFQAAKLLDRLQKEGVIGGYTGAVNRDVLLDKTAWAVQRTSFE